MKYYFISFFIFTLWLPAVSQHMITQIQTELTVSGSQYGSTIQYETKSKWGAGIFYQTELKTKEEAYSQKNNFWGVVVQAPLAKAERILFFVQLRAGLANNNFLVVVPGLETRLHISRHFGAAFGTSLRMGYPSVSGKLFLQLL